MTSMMRVTALGALAGCVMLTGCTNPPGAASPDPLASSQYPRIAALEGLKSDLSYDTPVVDKEPGRPMTVTVPLRWRGSSQVNVQYRFLFFDKDRRPVGPDPAWRQMFLPARAQEFVTGTALAKEADDWRLEVRPSRGEQ